MTVETGSDSPQDWLDDLSDRELEVLRLINRGLSDREIAEELFLSLNTIKWYNRQIYSKLGVANRKEAVRAAARVGLVEPRLRLVTPAVAVERPPLPAPVTALVGRERVVGDVRDLLASARLVTLIGPGGVGKTRLSVRVATLAEADGDFADGVYFVDLSPVRSPGLVAGAIAESLALSERADEQPEDALVRALRGKQVLLVIDNFEQVIDAADLIADLLKRASGLKCLVTSRENLQVYGEHIYAVPPLEPYAAIELFRQRAKAVKHDFAYTPQSKAAVERIVEKLDGLPLAVELAAARVVVLSPEAILERLERGLDSLKSNLRDLPGRHRTLRATLDWSYDLLEDDEKTLFDRLGVFSGGASLEAVEAVCVHDLALDLFEGLESLLHKSLLLKAEGASGEPRFWMLESMREYALQNLEARAALDKMRTRHAAYYAGYAEQAERHTRGGAHQMDWLQLLDADHDNLRSVYQWCIEGEGDTQQGLRLVGALGYFWWRQGHYGEGLAWTTRALELIDDAPVTVAAQVLLAAGRVSFYGGHPAVGKRVLREALAYFQELDNRREMGWTLVHLSALWYGQPEDYEKARTMGEEGLALLREVDDKPGIAQALANVGEFARLGGDPVGAKAAHGEALEIARAIGDHLREGIQLTNLGLIAQAAGDIQTADELFRQVLTLAVALDQVVLIVTGLTNLAGTAVALGYPERAAKLFGVAESLHSKYGFELDPPSRIEFDRNLADTRAQLDEAVFDAAWAQGRDMALDEAVAFALENVN